MPAASPHGTEAAYRRHLRHSEKPCQACLVAHDALNASRRVERRERVVGRLAPPPLELTAEGHVSRLEVLREMLDASRATIAELRRSEPARVYLLMREQREILSEIADLQGNGQVKGVTLADQLAEARARRNATA